MVLTHKQVSSRGGKSTFKRHGRKLFSENGHKGAATLLKRHGPEYFRELAKKGLAGRMKRYAEQKKKPKASS